MRPFAPRSHNRLSIIHLGLWDLSPRLKRIILAGPEGLEPSTSGFLRISAPKACALSELGNGPLWSEMFRGSLKDLG